MNLMDVFIKIGADTSHLEDGVKKSKGLVDSIGSGAKTAMKVAGAAVLGASTAMTGFAATAVNVGMTFDSSMSQVAATMGTTVDQIGELREYAQEMGAKTAFSATQAADALNYMALAGYDAEQSMTMLPNVLNLAAAGNMELATASDMVTDAQSALGLEMEDMEGFVDKLAKTSSKSNTSVQQLGDAILTVGGTAKVLKGGTTELATSLGILADNGIKGAEGGTKLRNVILSLSAPTDKAAEMLDQLGVSTVDAQGNMRPLDDIMQELSKSLEGMGTADKADIINTIFNKQDIAAVNALLDTSKDRWNELSAAIDDSKGAAEAMADTQLDNLEGDITLFKSALEGAQIQLSDALTPSLRKFVQAGTEGLGKITDFVANGGLSEAFENLKGIFERVSEAVSPITEAISGVITSEGSAQTATDLLSASFDLFIGALSLVSEAVGSVITGVSEFINWLNSGSAGAEAFKAGVIALTAAFGAYKAVTLATMIAQNAELILLGLQIAALDAVAVAQKLLNAVMAANPIGIVIAAIAALVAAFIYLWNTNEEFRNFWIGAWESIKGAFVTAWEAIKNFFTVEIPAAFDKFIEGIKQFGEKIKEGFNKVVEAGKEMVDKIKEVIKEKIDDAKNWGKDLIDNFVGGIKAKFDAVKKTISNVASTIRGYLHFSEPDVGPLSDFHTYAPDMMELFAKGIKDNERMLRGTVASAFDFTDLIGNAPSVTGGSSGETNIYMNIYGAVGQSVEELADIVSERINDATGRRMVAMGVTG